MPTVAAELNRSCFCITTDLDQLRREVEGADEVDATFDALRAGHPHLFASSPVFLDRGEVAAMRAVVSAVAEVVATPGWSAWAAEGLPATAGRDEPARGVFFGYDFHLGAVQDYGAFGAEGPQLIEINTNAGGALINLLLARAQSACCPEVQQAFPGVVALEAVEDDVIAMFREEWRRVRGDEPLATVAILDDDPETQFMYPEFRMFRRLFQRNGIEAFIVGPAGLERREDGLYVGETRIDLVYNRLCDFYLERPGSTGLREAWTTGQVVLTPHPRAHALYAHKRNLIALSDPAFLAELGVSAGAIATLIAGVPRTVEVTADRAEQLWAERRGWFFKPGDGYGGRAAYRGDKLTKGRWAELLATGGYVAQRLVTPSERVVRLGEEPVSLKVDIRAYVYAERIQLMAARLYQGQTTNLRTEGGGFAAVFLAGALEA